MKHALIAAIVVASAALASSATGRDESTIDLAAARIRSLPGATIASLLSNKVSVEQHGDQILVHAQSEVDADRATIWATLSDYDHLAQFIPGMSSSRTISRNGAEAIVEQKGIATFGPIRRKFTVLLAVRAGPAESIRMSGGGGDFKLYDARYDIVPLTPHHSRIVYEATIVPRIPLPSLFSLPIMRSMITSQFDALVDEMLRRAENAAMAR
jgi:carbon monoxide dehydrogenase subunit G